MKFYLYNTLIALALCYPLSARTNNLQAGANAFVENKGQIIDQNKVYRKDIDYKLDAGNIIVFIGKGQLHYQWYKTTPGDSTGNAPIETYRLDVSLLNANTNAVIENEELPGYEEQYYLPQCYGTVAHGFKKITYKNVYPNIDWVLYCNGATLKYDFVVHKGGRAADIRLQYGGATKLNVVNGSVEAATPFGSITEQKPYSYDPLTHTQIASSFVLEKNVVSFKLGTYDGDVVIDPAIVWGTYYGLAYTTLTGIKTDNTGNVYAVGSTVSTTNIATTGAYKTSFAGGNYDGLLVKFNSAGVRQWGTYFGGSQEDNLWGVAIDDNGNVYTAGNTYSSSGIATTGAHQISLAGNSDELLAKFSSSGALQWCTYYGGAAGTAYSLNLSPRLRVECDALGNIYMAGTEYSDTGIATSGSFHPNYMGSTLFGNGFLVKFNAAGVRQWGTYFGGADIANGSIGSQLDGLTVDETGDILIAGATSADTGIATTGTFMPVRSNYRCGFVAKFSPSGSRLWGTYYGGDGTTFSNSPATTIDNIVTDKSSNVYITGGTRSTTNIATINSNTSYPDKRYLAKLTPSGTRVWGRYCNDYQQWFVGITADTLGSVYLVGSTSFEGWNTGCGIPYMSNHIQEGFLACYDTAGSWLYGTYFGGTGSESTWGLTYNNADRAVYVCGNTGSTNNIATPGAHQTTGPIGDAFGFIEKFGIDTSVYIGSPFSDTSLCAGDTLKLKYGVLQVFRQSNSFTVQLSDSSGSFSSPANIGSATVATGGSITCVIPTGTVTGAHYKLRIVANAPVDTSCEAGPIGIGIAPPANLTATFTGSACTADTIHLHGASTSTNVMSWSWTGPGNYKSALQNPNIANTTINMAGVYTLTAAIYGCRATDTANVSLINTINAASATSNAPICRDDTLKLFAVAAGAGSFSWSGPGGFSSGAQDTVIANAAVTVSGDYILTANISGCLAKDTVSVVINPKVNVHSATSNSPVCTGDSLTLFANTTLGGVNFSWIGPATFSSSLQNPVRYNATSGIAGQYIVASSFGNGCYVYDTINVSVIQSPAGITASANAPICESDTLKLFSTAGSSGVTWLWTGPNSFSASTQNTSIVRAPYAASGRYFVKSIAANGCFRKDSVDAIVKPQPQNFSVSTNSPQCQGSALSFTAYTTSSGVAWQWTGANSYSSSLQSPSIANAQPANSGKYYLTATLNGCSIKDTETVAVIAIPATPVPAANTPVCVGQTLSLNAGVTAPGYLWSGPGGFISTVQTPTIPGATNALAGTYSVKAIDGSCMSTTATINVTVIPAPTVSMYPSPKDSICQGNTVSFLASSGNAGTSPVYKWYHNNTLLPGAAGATYNTNAAADNDTYFCAVTSNGTCATPYSDTSIVIQMRVFPWMATSVSISATPSGPVKGGDLVTFTATPVNGGNAPAYQWMRNNKPESGAISYTWGAKTLNNNDVVCVTMASSYMCPQPKIAGSNCITVSVDATGVADTKLSGIKIYPNPVKNELIIEHLATGTRVQLFDVMGRLMLETIATGEKEVLNTTSLVAGVYVLKLTDADGSVLTAKLTKN